jgi:DNA-binding phage protein
LERKIEKIRKKITKNSLEREKDIENYLNVMNKETETAQMARLKQNFERKNKKYSQEAEQLQVWRFFIITHKFCVEKARRMRTAPK